MELLSSNFDEIIQSAMLEYRDKGIQNVPAGVRIWIHLPKLQGFIMLPPIVCEVAMVNSQDFTFGVLLGFYTREIPQDKLEEFEESLRSFEEYLQEYNENNEEENGDESQTQ